MERKSNKRAQSILRMSLPYRWIQCFTLLCLLVAFTKQQQAVKVVCFGDSITYGALVDGKSWVEYLKNGDHKGYQFINAGRSGRKTSDKKELLPVLAAHPDARVFAIFLGVNDLKNGNDSMVESCVKNMAWMISKIKSQNPGTKILLLSPTDINTQDMNQINKDKLYNNHTKTALIHLERAYRNLAHKEHVSFLSLLHVVPENDYADGLHPNANGQQRLGKAIWNAIKNIK